MLNKEDRFEVVFKDGFALEEGGAHQILVDRETGVNYLTWKAGNAGGITPLLDSDGRIVVTPVER